MATTPTETGGITVTGTTPDPTLVKMPDIDYINYLVMNELIKAIKDLTVAIRSMR